jgi:hypothetical protein
MNSSPASPPESGIATAPGNFSRPVGAGGFSRGHWIALLGSLAICGIYTFSRLAIGWIPTDDGALAQSAMRVFQGQLPHRDFVELYTGGMSFYHALALQLFGVKLMSLRYAVFVIFLPAVAATYYIASRFASPVVAAAVTLLCTAWSLPAYPAAMPSWYNLFFALLGAAAMIRHIETDRPIWLVPAGLCAGLSIAVKITGLYFVAAALLLFVFREQQLASPPANSNRRVSPYRLFVTAGLAGFVALLFWMMRARMGQGELLHFILPGTALSVMLLANEWQQPVREDLPRFRHLFAMAIPFAAGLIVPLLILLLPYLRAHALRAVFADVIVGGSGTATALGWVRPAGFLYVLFVAPVAVLVALAWQLERGLSIVWYVMLAVAGAAIIVWARASVPFAVNPWLSAAMVTPVIVVAGAWMLWPGAQWGDLASTQRRQEIFLLLAASAVCGLVQFPFAAPIYFHYFAPLPALAAVALVSARRYRACDVVLGEVLAFYLLLGVFYVVPATIYNYGLGLELRTEPFVLPATTGMRVVDPGQYVALVRLVEQVAPGDTLLALPECSEFYFLTGRRNPTHADSFAIPDEVDRAMQDPKLRGIVINRRPVFPSSVPPQWLLEKVVTQFPNAAQIGQYQVRWR